MRFHVAIFPQVVLCDRAQQSKEDEKPLDEEALDEDIAGILTINLSQPFRLDTVLVLIKLTQFAVALRFL